MAALADHIQELHFNIHTGLGIQHMPVDDGADAVAAGDEALPLQGGQDIPQLGTADPQLFRQNALAGEPFTVGVFTVFHRGQQLGANGFGLSRLAAHFIHLVNELFNRHCFP